MPAPAHKVALTDRSLKALKPAAPGKRLVIWDSLMPGLAVRITDRGRVSFVAVKRRAGQSQPTWHLLGRYPLMALSEARAAAREALSALAAGDTPKALAEDKRRMKAEAQREHEANTFDAVAERFVKWYRETPGKGGGERRRWKEVADTIGREMTPVWGQKVTSDGEVIPSRPIASITRRDVTEAIDAIRARGGVRPAPGTHRKSGGPYAARHAFAAARLVFGWACEWEIIPTDPCAGLKAVKLHGPPEARSRVLDDDELRVVWDAAKATKYPYGPLIKLLLMTGARLREMAEASWSEVDLTAGTLTVSSARAKTKIAHVIPLPPAALAAVQNLPRFAGGGFLFSTTGGGRAISGFSKFRAQLDKTIASTGREIAAWTVHDLRRTCRTALSSLGISPVVAELVIGHRQQGIAKVYDLHRFDAEKRAALEAWEKRLFAIVGEPEPAAPGDNVVELATRARA